MSTLFFNTKISLTEENSLHWWDTLIEHFASRFIIPGDEAPTSERLKSQTREH